MLCRVGNGMCEEGGADVSHDVTESLCVYLCVYMCMCMCVSRKDQSCRSHSSCGVHLVYVTLWGCNFVI